MGLGNFGSCLKEVKPLVVYDGEQGIPLHAMKGNPASFLSEWQVSWFFSSCGGNLGYVLVLWQGKPLKTFVCSSTSGLLSSYDVHSRGVKGCDAPCQDEAGN